MDIPTKATVVAFVAPDGFSPDPLTDLLRQDARDQIAQGFGKIVWIFLPFILTRR